MHNIAIFDTETTNLDKPFCYNIGYVIADTDTDTILVKREYVIEQVWHNIPLFSTAYYADKRPLYIARMRSRQLDMEKIGYVTQQMIRDFRRYEVQAAYAFNSSFDDRVFQFNCDFFKVINPFDNMPIFDIRGYVHQFIAFDKKFQAFCELNERFTESGNYSTTAETLFQFMSEDVEFVEEHTALSDSLIEYEILKECVKRGAKYDMEYKTYASIPRKVAKPFTIVLNKEVVFSGMFTKKRFFQKENKYTFTNEEVTK